MKDKEIWKDIPNYEGHYQISNFGRVKSIERKSWNGNDFYTIKERFLKQGLNGNGYLHVGLSKNGNVKTCRIHVLVAVVFHNHKPNGKHDIVVDHDNNIKIDNNESNIKLVTNRQNTSKDRKNGTSKYVGVCWKKEINKWRASICLKHRKKHLGYFSNEYEAHLAYQKELNLL